MFKLAFATDKAFREERQRMDRAWQSYRKGIKSEYQKQRKVFTMR